MLCPWRRGLGLWLQADGVGRRWGASIEALGPGRDGSSQEGGSSSLLQADLASGISGSHSRTSLSGSQLQEDFSGSCSVLPQPVLVGSVLLVLLLVLSHLCVLYAILISRAMTGT